MFKMLIRFLLVLTWVPCAWPAGKVEFNVDFACGWDGCYRPMEWTPIEIGISSNLTEPFGGSLVFSGQQDAQNNLNIVQPFVLTPNVQHVAPLVTKLTFGVSSSYLTIRDERARVRWEQAIDFWNSSGSNRMLRAVREQDMLIGVVGQPLFNLLRLGQDAVCLSAGQVGKVYVGYKPLRSVPWDWTGFVSLDVLVVCNPDWTQLRAEQVQAVCEWVSNGGIVLVVLGSHPLPPDNPLARTIPFNIGQPRQVTIPAQVLTQWGLDSDATETVTAWSLSSKPDVPVVRSAKSDDGMDLYGLGLVGFGRIAVLAFDPSQLSDKQTLQAGAFWTTHIATCLSDQLAPMSSSTDGAAGPLQAGSVSGRAIILKEHAPQEEDHHVDHRYQVSESQRSVNKVLEYLYDLEQMRPLSIWWVILILASMALLLGPIDYMVLKRLDRLPYTWLTSIGWIVVFTVGAYYGVQALRGGNMQLRAVTVLDSLAGSRAAWTTHYLGAFAPRSDDYRIEGLRPRQWWSGLTSSADQMYPQPGALVKRQITCMQNDGSNLPISLPINIWTVQSLIGESPSDEVLLQATVERKDNTVVVEITNASRDQIRTGFILFKDAYIDIPTIPAGASQRLERYARPFNPWVQQHGSYSVQGRGGSSSVNVAETPCYPPGLSQVATGAFQASGCWSRTLAMHEYLQQGAALVCVEFENPSVPFGVENRSYETAYVRLARQVVWPKNVLKENGDD
jgi:hypothetical protein